MRAARVALLGCRFWRGKELLCTLFSAGPFEDHDCASRATPRHCTSVLLYGNIPEGSWHTSWAANRLSWLIRVCQALWLQWLGHVNKRGAGVITTDSDV